MARVDHSGGAWSAQEKTVKRMSSILKLAVLAVVGVSLTGCIVLPWGGHRQGGGGGHGGGRHHLSAGAPPPAIDAAPREPFYGRGR